MTTAVASTNDVDRSAASAAPTQSAPKAPTQSQPSTATASLQPDTVSISKAAHAAQQEAIETQAQTAREAAQGDHQAQRLAAKEAAATKA